MGTLDIFLCLTSGQYVSFTPSVHIKNFQGLGTVLTFICDVVQCIYVDRAASKDELDNTVKMIEERMDMAEKSDVDWPPVMMYAEGTVTNGLNVSRFRRGSFQSLKPVKPMVMKYYWKKVNPDCSTNLGMEFFPFIFSEWGLKDLTLTHFPTFVPNDYLFSTYAKTIKGHEKMEKWEIYAHAVRDFLQK